MPAWLLGSLCFLFWGHLHPQTSRYTCCRFLSLSRGNFKKSWEHHSCCFCISYRSLRRGIPSRWLSWWCSWGRGWNPHLCIGDGCGWQLISKIQLSRLFYCFASPQYSRGSSHKPLGRICLFLTGLPAPSGHLPLWLWLKPPKRSPS